jgi:hypothetical protein
MASVEYLERKVEGKEEASTSQEERRMKPRGNQFKVFA